MKLFSCTNKSCKSNVPYDAETNKVIQRITSDHKVLKNGEIDDKLDAKIHRIEYICGRCGAKVVEVPLKTVMKIIIERVNKHYAFGIFYNKLRKRKYKFDICKETGEISFDELKNSLKVEEDFIREEYKNKYTEAIDAEVINFETDKANIKTWEVLISNPNMGDSLTLFIKDGDVVESYADRKPLGIEVKKAKQKVKEVPY